MWHSRSVFRPQVCQGFRDNGGEFPLDLREDCLVVRAILFSSIRFPQGLLLSRTRASDSRLRLANTRDSYLSAIFFCPAFAVDLEVHFRSVIFVCSVASSRAFRFYSAHGGRRARWNRAWKCSTQPNSVL